MDNDRIEQLGHIIDENQQALLRFAFFRTGSLADSQDIVQNAFLKMYDRNRSLSRVENLKSYLYRAVSNSCTDHLRRKRTNRNVPLDHAAPVVQPFDETHAEYVRINELMSELPHEQAEVIRLRIMAGANFALIGEILDIPVPTAKSRFRYGIEKLRKTIAHYEL